MTQDIDLAAVAALIGEPTRACILSALLGGEALPASELAYRAYVTPQTASSHLAKLLDGDLIKVTAIGRHRYYSLKNYEVAEVLETLQRIAPLPEPKAHRARKIDDDLCQARTCYDHLAGKLGVAFTQSLLEKDYLREDEQNYKVTDRGKAWLMAWEIDLEALKTKRRKFAYACLDWSERRFHLAGTLGAAITTIFIEHSWVKRIPKTRALKVTAQGRQVLKRDFAIDWHDTIAQPKNFST